MIKVEEAEVVITEQTLLEISRAIEQAKEKFISFSSEEFPECDMSIENYNKEWAKRGRILVSSPHCPISYRIILGTQQESAGYKAQL